MVVGALTEQFGCELFVVSVTGTETIEVTAEDGLLLHGG